jgi:hypothetical protein
MYRYFNVHKAYYCILIYNKSRLYGFLISIMRKHQDYKQSIYSLFHCGVRVCAVRDKGSFGLLEDSLLECQCLAQQKKRPTVK